MVDSKMGEDLLSFGTKILVLGDPAQLPPVMGGGFFTEGCKPDVMLTDIHRQAKDNPIIAMATKVRNQQQLALGSYGNSSVVDKDGVCPQDALDADQILVGRNKTRHGSNRRVRSLRGITEDYPVVSDKLVCLRNNHENGLLNGAIWHIDDVGNKDDKRIIMTLSPDEGDENRTIEVESHVQHFLGQEVPFWERKEAEEFDYGYALTVHKSQGSQWDNVILFDEAACFREDRWRWLYTGITRAAETLKVVRL
jgi:exodeoxyribonuclease-5